ncbi:MAG: LPXTG cell wall anchor domain-containing protein, partial [Bacteriovoracaceae bacterium]|nr:LPXTG cell wall anchor domain-containing protein [Bacteriovoracaceae bacterium]
GKDFYEAYQPVFDQVVSTLRVFRQAKGQMAQTQLKNSDENLIGDSTYIPDDELSNIGVEKQKRSSGGKSSEFIFYGLVLVGIGGYILYRKRKKK